MTMTRYDREVERLIAQAERMGDREVVKAIRLLQEARRRIAESVAVTEWDLYHLPRLKSAVDDVMSEFAARYSTELINDELHFWNFGQTMVDKTLAAAGISMILPAIDPALLTAMQGYSDHLVVSLGRDAAAKIYNEFAMGLMGEKSPYDVMRAVGRNLKEPGIFKSIAARAETITRQECGRILAAASQARMEKAAEAVEGLQKIWRHGVSKVPRMTHIAAIGQARPVNEPFTVGGEALMYPRDPAGSPGNTINCSCYTVPYMEGWSKAA